jgi:dTDP-glucose 4,6-dehydratase
VLGPGAIYGEGKRVSELLCALYAAQSGMECKIARCFAFAGPGLPLDANFAIGNFIRDAMAGRPIEIAGDGTPLRSYLYAADLAVWLWTILLRGASLEALNVGSERAVSIAELARVVAATLRPGLAVKIARAAEAGVAPARYVPATERARGRLGLVETVGLEEAVRRTATWSGVSALPATPSSFIEG